MASIRFGGESGDISVNGHGSDWECYVEVYIQHKSHAGTGVRMGLEEAEKLLVDLPAQILKARLDHEWHRKERETNV